MQILPGDLNILKILLREVRLWYRIYRILSISSSHSNIDIKTCESSSFGTFQYIAPI